MNSKKVLIVEDNEDTRRIYALVLEHFGYEAHEAVHGGEGVEAARRLGPDLILMDLSMPIMDGWQANEALKSEARTASIPVVMVTAHGGTVTPDEALRAGFAGFLPKPIDTRRLVQEVERLIGRP